MRLLLINILIFILLPFGVKEAKAQERAVWATAWDVNTPAKIDAMLANLHHYGFNRLFIQARYRGDALYFPNKNDSTRPNPDIRCYLLKDSLFDPLGYAIEKARALNISVSAWVTTFVVTPHDLQKIDSNHVFYRHPEWLVQDSTGRRISFSEYEGAFLDPALEGVRQYTLNVVSDIAANYPELAGIQLDYIRYPDSLFGWNEESRRLADSLPGFDFNQWKINKISSFLNLAYITLKNINPRLEISVAAISDSVKRFYRYSQDWERWLREGYVDRVYVMAYNTSNRTFSTLIQSLNRQPHRDKISIIVRAWQENKTYHYSKINDKLKILKQYHFGDVGFYNYSGLINYHYLGHIKF